MKYFIQPYFRKREISRFSVDGSGVIIAASTPATSSIDSDIRAVPSWSNPGINTGPNAVLVHKQKVFVSIDKDSNSGGILVYDVKDIFPRTIVAPVILLPGGGRLCFGMAIQPSTGDLFVGTYNSGIWRFTEVSGYSNASGSQFVGVGAAIKAITANLCFDQAGNLWASTWDPNTDPDWDRNTNDKNHLVVCFKDAKSTDAYTFQNAKLPLADVEGKNFSNNGNAPLNAFSCPEGLVFDPSGNLWVGNNNDYGKVNDFGKGTILKIASADIAALLNSPSKSRLITANFLGFENAQFGGLTIHGNTLFANDQRVSGQVDGNVKRFDVKDPTLFITASFSSSGIPSDNPGNGSGAVVDALYIKDNKDDFGQQPNKSTTISWDSPEIWVTAQSNNSSVNPTDNEILFGDVDCYIHVRVTNTGIGASAGNETLELSWAKGGSTLGWTSPWDGGQIVNPMTGAPYLRPMGKKIGTQTLPVIPRGEKLVLHFPWKTLKPEDYTLELGIEDIHFCLLARLITETSDPYGMAFPEKTDAIQSNTLNNGAIAWKNTHFNKITPLMGPGGGLRGPGGVLSVNYGKGIQKTRIKFQLINSQGKLVDFEPGSLSLRIAPESFEKITPEGRERLLSANAEQGVYTLQFPEAGFEAVVLKPQEFFTCHLQYRPEDPAEGFAITSIHTLLGSEEESVIGGQTFVFGKVEGFPVSEASQETEPQPTPGGSQQPGARRWLWIALFLLLLLLIVLFFYATP